MPITDLDIHPDSALAMVEDSSLEQNRVLIYLARFKKSSRRICLNALARFGCLQTRQSVYGPEQLLRLVSSVDWARLRFQHTNLIRSRLAELIVRVEFSLSSANLYRVALRGVLKTV